MKLFASDDTCLKPLCSARVNMSYHHRCTTTTLDVDDNMTDTTTDITITTNTRDDTLVEAPCWLGSICLCCITHHPTPPPPPPSQATAEFYIKSGKLRRTAQYDVSFSVATFENHLVKLSEVLFHNPHPLNAFHKKNDISR